MFSLRNKKNIDTSWLKKKSALSRAMIVPVFKKGIKHKQQTTTQSPRHQLHASSWSMLPIAMSWTSLINTPSWKTTSTASARNTPARPNHYHSGDTPHVFRRATRWISSSSILQKRLIKFHTPGCYTRWNTRTFGIKQVPEFKLF